jgi:hypothetical protein
VSSEHLRIQLDGEVTGELLAGGEHVVMYAGSQRRWEVEREVLPK